MTAGAPAKDDKTPRTARGERTRRALLSAAAEEFGEKGFHDGSISGITRRAGCALGSFYTYFDSKDDIFRALVNDMSGQVRDYVSPRIAQARDGIDAERIGLLSFLEFARAHKEIYRIIDEAEFVDQAAYRAHYENTASRMAARLAKALGIRYDIVPIEPVFEQLKSQLGDIFDGLDEDTAEENMQARIRGNILMSMSNKFGSLLLTTGNKSELAVGYCTLYGDMCGGLAVISDLPKTRVYSLAKWINREREIIPESTLTKPPSAELRPDQVDQDSLPPYDVLDSILEAYVVDGQDAESIIASGHDKATVQRIIRLINVNEYKRRQAAPGIKVTSKAFGVGRRIPVAKRFS